MYEKYKDQGFVIVGFPANNFSGQEPGTRTTEIKQFCTEQVQRQLPDDEQDQRQGRRQAPAVQVPDAKRPTAGDFAGDIGWNFAKFLVDRNGNVIARFASKTTPEDPRSPAANRRSDSRRSDHSSVGVGWA